MILLYTLLLLALGGVKALIDRRARQLERKYARTAAAADQILREPIFKQGNTSKPDLCQSAKRYYVLGQLIQKRDRLEIKHEAWQALADRLAASVTRVRDWKGKKLPYTFGALDVSALLYALDALGAGDYVNAKVVLAQIAALLGR